MNEHIVVEFIPNSNAFSTLVDMVDKVSFPNELFKILSHLDFSKFNPIEKERVKKMAIHAAINLKDAAKSNDVDKALKNCDVEYQFISDIDYKMSNLIDETDIAMFDV